MNKLRNLEAEEKKAFDNLADSLDINQIVLCRRYINAKHFLDLERIKQG